MPPRAVSRTATSTSDRSRICLAPAGPVQSPGSTRRPSTSTPSEVVYPTRRPEARRMAAIIRVVVVLPLVPLMLMIGSRRSASRSQAGGVSPAARMRASARVTVRLRRTGVVGARSRSQQRQAASAISRARSCSRQGNATIQAPGSLVRWTVMGSLRRRPRASSSSASQASASVRRWSRRTQAVKSRTGVGTSRARTGRPSSTTAWAPGWRCPYHVRRRPTVTSILTVGSRR